MNAEKRKIFSYRNGVNDIKRFEFEYSKIVAHSYKPFFIFAGFLLLQENVAVGMIPEYFNKYYHIAVNVYLFGTALGVIVSPLLTQMFLDIFGWRGAILMLCGINMQSIVAGAILKRSRSNHEEQLPILRYQVPDDQKTDVTPHFEYLKTLKKILKAFDVNLLGKLLYFVGVFVPSIANGYLITSWLIYIVSYALSNGASLKESTVVATWGGIGIAIIRLALPYLNSVMSYRYLMYISTVVMAISLCLTTVFSNVVGMSTCSLVFGIAYGIFGTEIYVAAKDIAEDDQYYNAVSWAHLAYGFAAVTGASLTG